MWQAAAAAVAEQLCKGVGRCSGPQMPAQASMHSRCSCLTYSAQWITFEVQTWTQHVWNSASPLPAIQQCTTVRQWCHHPLGYPAASTRHYNTQTKKTNSTADKRMGLLAYDRGPESPPPSLPCAGLLLRLLSVTATKALGSVSTMSANR